MNPISFRPQQSCKKDYTVNIDNQFEEYKKIEIIIQII